MAENRDWEAGGEDHALRGPRLEPGMRAPDFKLIANDLTSRCLADYAGMIKIISVIPSIDTSICSQQTLRFNREAGSLGDDVVILTVSADLPYALSRYCGAQGIENTETLSTYRDMLFADDYGVHDIEWRLCQRAVFVIDREDIVRYVEYAGKMGDMVDFESALTSTRALL